MKCRFLVTLWILWLPQEILSRPPTTVDSAEVYANSDPAGVEQIGDYGYQTEGEWESDALDAPDEHQDGTEDTVRNPDHEKTNLEQPENQIDATPNTSKEISSERTKEAEADSSIELSKSLEASSSDDSQEREEERRGAPEAFPQLAKTSGYEVPPISENAPGKEKSKDLLRKEGASQVAGLAVEEGLASSEEEFEKKGPKGSGEGTPPAIMKDAEIKSSVTSVKQPVGNNLPKNPEKKVTKGEESKKKLRNGPTQAAPSEKLKGQTVRNQFTLSADRKNMDGNKRQSPNNTGNTLHQTKLRKQKSDLPKTTTKSHNPNREEFVGNISELLSTIGQKIGSFEDINKKSRVEKGSQLKRSVPSVGTLAPKDLGSKLAKKSVPEAGKTKQATISLSANPLFRKKSPPWKETELNSKSKKKPSNTLKSRYPPASKRELVVTADGPGRDPTKEKSGTEDYERLMAQRLEQIDEPEDKPISLKQLPQRLNAVTGDFQAIANQLGSNIKSVSAANKDMTSRRGLVPKTPVERIPLARRGPLDDSDPEVYDENEVQTRGDDCKCYNKYSAFNMVRRTAKRVVRAVRDGTNRIYDGVDFTIAKSKDIKDAVKSDIVDPAVQMIPLVGPAIGAVVDTSDVIADSAISGARQVVQGGKGLNDGVLSGMEGILKKDKTCRCVETREEEVVD